MFMQCRKHICILITVCLIIGVLSKSHLAVAMMHTEDFTFVNYSEVALTPRVYDGVEIFLQQLWCEKGEFHFLASATNISNEAKSVMRGRLYFWNCQGDLLGEADFIAGSINPGETTIYACSLTSRMYIESIYDWSLAFFDEGGEEPKQPPKPATDSTVNTLEKYLYIRNEAEVLKKKKTLGGLTLSMDSLFLDRGKMHVLLEAEFSDLWGQQKEERMLELFLYDEYGRWLLGGYFRLKQSEEGQQYCELTNVVGDLQAVLLAEDWTFRIINKDIIPSFTPSPTVAPTLIPTGEFTAEPALPPTVPPTVTPTENAMQTQEPTEEPMVTPNRTATATQVSTDKPIARSTWNSVSSNITTRLKKPVISLKKGVAGKKKFVEISVKQEKGSTAEVYMKKKGSYRKIKCRKRYTSTQKSKYRLYYKKRQQQLWFKVRICKIVNGNKCYSKFSQIKKIRT